MAFWMLVFLGGVGAFSVTEGKEHVSIFMALSCCLSLRPMCVFVSFSLCLVFLFICCLLGNGFLFLSLALPWMK